MPALEKIGLEAIFDTSEFQRGQRIYERSVRRVERVTEDMAARSERAADRTAASWTSMAASAGIAAGAVALASQAASSAWELANEAMEARGLETSAAQIEAAMASLSDQIGVMFIPAVQTASADLLVLIGYLERAAKTATQVTAMVHASWAAFEAWREQILSVGQALAAGPGGLAQLAFEFGKSLWDQEESISAADAAMEAYEETMLRYAELLEPIEEATEKTEKNYEKMAEELSKAFARIEDLGRDHYLRLADMEADANRQAMRAFDKYSASLQKQEQKHQKALEKVTAGYEKRRVKTIAAYQKRIARAEAGVNEARIKAQEDYDRRERQARERYHLDNIQSERRYQFERNRLVAEGDTLAIEQLDARYALEQEEAKENERLRERQARQGQAEQIQEAGEAAREQINELQQQLAETLDEQEAGYLEQIAGQRQANADRLNEMTRTYQEQQRLRDEDVALARQKAEANYQRQQEDLGRNLARQEELQELGAGEVERLLERYYGEDGVADRIMQGWHERENLRILSTAALMTAMGEWKPLLPGGIPMPGQIPGMQMGGVLQGPAMAYVEPGVTEAFVPLTGPGAGGAFTHEFMNALNITGLEGASSADVSRIAKELATSLTSKIRSRRRS